MRPLCCPSRTATALSSWASSRPRACCCTGRRVGGEGSVWQVLGGLQQGGVQCLPKQQGWSWWGCIRGKESCTAQQCAPAQPCLPLRPPHPPGTGKTLIARACAAQTNATFLKLAGTSLVQVRTMQAGDRWEGHARVALSHCALSIACSLALPCLSAALQCTHCLHFSPSPAQMFIGDGAKMVRDAFALAKEKQPCIIFIDEIDSIGARRGGGCWCQCSRVGAASSHIARTAAVQGVAPCVGAGGWPSWLQSQLLLLIPTLCVFVGRHDAA